MRQPNGCAKLRPRVALVVSAGGWHNGLIDAAIIAGAANGPAVSAMTLGNLPAYPWCSAAA